MVLRRTTSRFALFAALGLVAISAALSAPITAGNFVMTRVGTGAAALSNASTAVFLDEYTPSGTFVQSIAVSTAASGANLALTMSGTSTAEGGLTISPDGRYVSFTGYNAAPGVASISGTASASTNRVVGILDLTTGTVDTSTGLTDAYSTNSIRAAVVSGNNIWTAGTGTNPGARYTTLGTVGTSTQLSTTVTNLRRIEIFNGQLYVSSASGAFLGVSTVGTGTPTTSGQTTTLLPGFSSNTGGSAYDFWFADANTVYVADDRTLANSGGIQKWTQSGGTWSLAYTMNNGLTNGMRGLTGINNGGTVTLFGTSADTASKFVSVTDSGAASLFATLATASGNTAFRGIEFAALAAVPEPGTIALIALAALPGAALLRRRK